ncbi:MULTISPECIES: TetR/AcrR family transcriptional regulator [Streptomyces]|uniref:TetR/AcrR family transcriptional regulator n=1 Tax=Streptomyces TaxID=1883 RepID=UPI000F54F0D6|nr:TetR/AcrR family transcriptional regulator [Streptomyces sp. ADI97-07]RPK84248.1 DNA-binding transcriptional regulator EnvR [Streptomyces sp. ADI97-07]
MVQRKERADALRNRQAVLAAADGLFARSPSPRSVSMDDVAAAAGVGKGTLFRRFGDRTGLIRALYEARVQPLRDAVESGPPPLGPSAQPHDRVEGLLDAALGFKLDNRHLALALEEVGSGSPYQAAHYTWWHRTLQETLERIPSVADGEFIAHALLAATRADLVEHLAGQEHMTAERMRSELAAYVSRVLPSASGSGKNGESS